MTAATEKYAVLATHFPIDAIDTFPFGVPLVHVPGMSSYWIPATFTGVKPFVGQTAG